MRHMINAKMAKTRTMKRKKSKGLEVKADVETIIMEASHIPDRDQSFALDHKQYPLPEASVASWVGDHEERLIGDRDSAYDAYDELEHVEDVISEPSGRSLTESSTPTAVPYHYELDRMSYLDDQELKAAASAWGIPMSPTMGRPALISAIKDIMVGH